MVHNMLKLTNVFSFQLRQMIEEVDTDKSGTIEFEEFIQMIKKARSSGGKGASSLYRISGASCLSSVRDISGQP